MKLVDLETSLLGRWLALSLAFFGLLTLTYDILKPFLTPLVWAGILVYITWPLFRLFQRLFRGNLTGAALVMTILLALLFVLPTLWLAFSIAQEAPLAFQKISHYIGKGQPLPAFIRDIPWIGDTLERSWVQLNQDSPAFREQLVHWLGQGSGYLTSIIGGLGRVAAKTLITLFSAYFLYRHGEELVRQTRLMAVSLIGDRAHDYLTAIADTIRAVVYGLILTALAQAALAGLGYWVAGVEAPLILAVITFLLALIPFGTPFVWGGVSLWLFMDGHTWPAIGLAIWGAVVVSWIDNLIRPLVISSAINISFLLVMFGVLGGLAAFGFVGLFVGPVILAIVMAVWRERLEEIEIQNRLLRADELRVADSGKSVQVSADD